jgi:hypothetical protein
MNMQDDIKKIIEQFYEMNRKISVLDVAQSKNKAAVIVLKARVVDLKIRMAELERQLNQRTTNE